MEERAHNAVCPLFGFTCRNATPACLPACAALPVPVGFRPLLAPRFCLSSTSPELELRRERFTSCTVPPRHGIKATRELSSCFFFTFFSLLPLRGAFIFHHHHPHPQKGHSSDLSATGESKAKFRFGWSGGPVRLPRGTAATDNGNAPLVATTSITPLT